MPRIRRLLKKCGNIFFRVRVSGESALPILTSGRLYYASSLWMPRVGRWIVFQNPARRDEIFIKRVAKIENRKYFVESTVSWGASSKDFGSVDYSHIIGTLIGI